MEKSVLRTFKINFPSAFGTDLLLIWWNSPYYFWWLMNDSLTSCKNQKNLEKPIPWKTWWYWATFKHPDKMQLCQRILVVTQFCTSYVLSFFLSFFFFLFFLQQFLQLFKATFKWFANSDIYKDTTSKTFSDLQFYSISTTFIWDLLKQVFLPIEVCFFRHLFFLILIAILLVSPKIFKARLPPSKNIFLICFNKSSLNMMRNAFYFMLSI